MVVRELELDLDAFEGPFDLLLTLVLKEELDLYDVDVAQIVLAFVERLADREQLELESCGEFLGLRINAWVAAVVFVLSTLFFIWWQFIRRGTGADRPRASRVVPEGPAMAVPKSRVRPGN